MTNNPKRTWSGLRDPFYILGPDRIPETAKARLVKFCTQVVCVDVSLGMTMTPYLATPMGYIPQTLIVVAKYGISVLFWSEWTHRCQQVANSHAKVISDGRQNAPNVLLLLLLLLLLLFVLKHFYFITFIPSDIVFYSLYFSLAYFIVMRPWTSDRGRYSKCSLIDWLIDIFSS